MANKIKRASIAVFLAGVLAVPALSLTACNPDTSNSDDFESYKSERVETEAAWSEAFDFDGIANVTYALNIEYEGQTLIMNVGYVDDSYSSAITYEFDGDKIHYKDYRREVRGTEQSEKQDDLIFDKSDGITVYGFDKENGEWISYSVEPDALAFYGVDGLSASMRNSGIFDTTIGGIDVRDIGLECALRSQYSMFEYDDKAGAYVYKHMVGDGIGGDDGDGDYLNFAVKIKDGKFCSMNVDFQYAHQTGTICSRLSGIGTTVVTLPTA